MSTKKPAPKKGKIIPPQGGSGTVKEDPSYSKAAGVAQESAPIDGSHKDLLEVSSGETLTKEEWASVRQCLRCLVQGKRIFRKQIHDKDAHGNVTGNSKTVGRIGKIVGAEGRPETGVRAVVMVLKEANNSGVGIVEAARKLTFVAE